MNKKAVDKLIPVAIQAIEDCEIANKQGEIPKTMRGYISSFGAAVSGGSLLSAVMFFSEKGGSEEDRCKITKALYQILKKQGIINSTSTGDDLLYKYVIEQIKAGKEIACKQSILEAAIALKLAMNAFVLKK